MRFSSSAVLLAALAAGLCGCPSKFEVAEDAQLSCASDADCPDKWHCDVGSGFCHLTSKPYEPPRPTLVFSAPPDEQQEVAVNTLVIFAFSMRVDAGSLTGRVHLTWNEGTQAEAFTLTEPVPGTFQLEPTRQLQADTGYTLSIDPGIKPAKGTAGAESLVAQPSVQFKTGLAPDRTGPDPVSGLVVTDVEATRTELRWTPPAADFAGALVVRRAGGPTRVEPKDGTTYAIGACLDGEPGPCDGRDEVIGWTLGSQWIDVTRPAGPVGYAVFAFDAVNNYSSPRRPVFVQSTDLWWCPGAGGFTATTPETDGTLQLRVSKGAEAPTSWPPAPVGLTQKIDIDLTSAGTPFVLGEERLIQPVFSREEAAYLPRPTPLTTSDVDLGAGSRIEATGPGAPVHFHFAPQGWSAFLAEVDTDPTVGQQTWQSATSVDAKAGAVTAIFAAPGSYRFRVRPAEPRCAPVADAQATLSPEFALGAALYVSAASAASPATGADPAHALPTIAAALAAVPATTPTSVFVAEGTYAERLVVPASVSLFGGYSADFTSRDSAAHPSRVVPAGSPAITIQGARVVLDGFAIAASGEDSLGVRVEGPDATVRGCSFQGPLGAQSCNGLQCWMAEGFRVEGSSFEMAGCTDSRGIYLVQCSGAVVRANRVAASTGIDALDSEAIIESNTITPTATGGQTAGIISGIKIDGSSPAVVVGNDVRAGPPTSARTAGLLLIDSHAAARATGNRLHGGSGASTSAVLIVGANAPVELVVADNLLHSGTGAGLRSCFETRSRAGIFTGNTCFVGGEGVNGHGVFVWQTGAPSVTNNLFFGSSGFEVAAENTNPTADLLSLENNVVLGHPGVWLFDLDGAQTLTTPAQAEANMCAQGEFSRGNVELDVDPSTVLRSVGGADGDADTLWDNDWSLRDTAPVEVRTGGKDVSVAACGAAGADFTGGVCVSPGSESCGEGTEDFAGSPRTVPSSVGAFENDAG
ncbi:MAG TPA: Ig-like domain-containing protein [Myxococcales bacterium]|jgi:hypothetical protein